MYRNQDQLNQRIEKAWEKAGGPPAWQIRRRLHVSEHQSQPSALPPVAVAVAVAEAESDWLVP